MVWKRKFSGFEHYDQPPIITISEKLKTIRPTPRQVNGIRPMRYHYTGTPAGNYGAYYSPGSSGSNFKRVTKTAKWSRKSKLVQQRCKKLWRRSRKLTDKSMPQIHEDSYCWRLFRLRSQQKRNKDSSKLMNETQDTGTNSDIKSKIDESNKPIKTLADRYLSLSSGETQLGKIVLPNTSFGDQWEPADTKNSNDVVTVVNRNAIVEPAEMSTLDTSGRSSVTGDDWSSGIYGTTMTWVPGSTGSSDPTPTSEIFNGYDYRYSAASFGFQALPVSLSPFRPLVSAFDEKARRYQSCCCFPIAAVRLLFGIEVVTTIASTTWILLAMFVWDNLFAAWAFTVVIINFIATVMLYAGVNYMVATLTVPYMVIKVLDTVLCIFLAVICTGVLMKNAELTALLTANSRLWDFTKNLEIDEHNIHVHQTAIVIALVVLTISLILLLTNGFSLIVSVKAHLYITDKLRILGTQHMSYNDVFSFNQLANTFNYDIPSLNNTYTTLSSTLSSHRSVSSNNPNSTSNTLKSISSTLHSGSKHMQSGETEPKDYYTKDNIANEVKEMKHTAPATHENNFAKPIAVDEKPPVPRSKSLERDNLAPDDNFEPSTESRNISASSVPDNLNVDESLELNGRKECKSTTDINNRIHAECDNQPRRRNQLPTLGCNSTIGKGIPPPITPSEISLGNGGPTRRWKDDGSFSQTHPTIKDEQFFATPTDQVEAPQRYHHDYRQYIQK